MFITKKKHKAIVADLEAEIKNAVADFTAEIKNANDRLEEMRKQRDAAQKLAGVLDKLADKSASFSTFAASSLNWKSELQLPDNVPVYVDDHFGGKVIKQEVTKVIEISAEGVIKTGLTKRTADDCYVLVRNRREAK